MATPLDRVVGSTTASAYGRGPASGVDYFAAPGQYRGAAMQAPSNVTPGAQDLVIEDEPYDVGVYDGGGGGYGGGEAVQGSPQSAVTLGNLGYGLGIAGQVMGEPGLSMAGGTLGAVAAGQQGNFGPAVGLATGLATGNPGLATAANLGTQMATGAFSATPSNIGGLVGGLMGGPVGGFVGSQLGGLAQDALANNPDVAASLANAVNTVSLGYVDPMDAMMGLTGNFGAAPGPSFGDVAVSSPVSVGTVEGTPLGAPTGDTGGGGYGTNAGTSAESGAGQAGNSAGSGTGTDSDGAGTSFAADGGLATPTGFSQVPGLTRRYADGGPLLAMGYAQGGSVQMGPTPGSTSVTAQVNRILRDPRLKQEIAARAQALMDSGELTTDEVQIMARVAEAAMYNQQLYPQLRQFVAEQGMTPLPAAYDPATIVKIMAIARVLQEVQPATPPGQVPPVEQAQVSPPPGMKQGGLINGPGTGRSDSIGTINRSSGEPVSVANNEYIIPEHVVRIKGREFFDKLLARYENAPKEQA